MQMFGLKTRAYRRIRAHLLEARKEVSEVLENLPVIIEYAASTHSRTAQAFKQIGIVPDSDLDRALAYLVLVGAWPGPVQAFAKICARGSIQPEDIERLRDAGINTDPIEGWYGWPT